MNSSQKQLLRVRRICLSLPGTREKLSHGKPPYVGARGWVGINPSAIRDDDFRFHIEVAWELVAPKRLR